MEYKIVKRFYSSIHANIYYLRLKDAGFACFLSSENISTILPLSNGGVQLNVAVDQIEDAIQLIAQIEKEEDENKNSQDFKNATEDDINYEKKVNEYEKWLSGGWLNMDIVSSILFLLFVIVVLGIVINFFFPFVKNF